MKHLRRHVLGPFAIAQAPPDVRVHPLEVNFVERGETAWVLLSRLDQPTLAGFLYGLQRELPSSCCPSIELAGRGKVTVEVAN